MHITQGDYDGKAVIISWVTPDEPGSSKVHYGTVLGKYEFVAQGTYSNYTFYKYKSGFTHHCLVSGLEVTNYTKKILLILLFLKQPCQIDITFSFWMFIAL